MRLDPRAPHPTWDDFSDSLAGGQITAMDNAPSGSVLVALASGKLVEVDGTDRRLVSEMDAPGDITELRTDGLGRIWIRAGGKSYRKEAHADAWQKTWELAARLPGGNHDLSGEAVGTKFYMAGGQTAAWGYPATAHVFDGLFEFDEPSRQWRVAAKLRHPRFYNGTAVLGGAIWVIAGCNRDSAGKAVSLSSVEILDPKTGANRNGPEMPFAIEMPLAVHIGNRIYVAGSDKLLSIGIGEAAWKAEADMPIGGKALAGCVWNGRFYVTIPKLGLAAFDPRAHAWSLVSPEWQPRSAQVAAYRNALWLMGGRDIADGRTTMTFDGSAWRHGPDLPRELAWGAAAVVNGKLMVTGGAAGSWYNNRTFILR
jgi:hypothetical protein